MAKNLTTFVFYKEHHKKIRASVIDFKMLEGIVLTVLSYSLDVPSKHKTSILGLCCWSTAVVGEIGSAMLLIDTCLFTRVAQVL